VARRVIAAYHQLLQQWLRQSVQALEQVTRTAAWSASPDESHCSISRKVGMNGASPAQRETLARISNCGALEEAGPWIVAGFDVHRAQITFDAFNDETGPTNVVSRWSLEVSSTVVLPLSEATRTRRPPALHARLLFVRQGVTGDARRVATEISIAASETRQPRIRRSRGHANTNPQSVSGANPPRYPHRRDSPDLKSPTGHRAEARGNPTRRPHSRVAGLHRRQFAGGVGPGQGPTR
jgi:hypothetical protein